MIPVFTKPDSRYRNVHIANEPKSNKDLKFSLFLPFLFFLLYGIAISATNWILFMAIYGMMGFLTVFIFLFIIHEAVHGAYFKKQVNNDRILYLFDLLGANSYIFKKRHLLAHHNFCNVESWDTDIEQSGLMKIYPFKKSSAFQNYQHFFIFFLYPLYALNWLFVRDFRDFFYSGSIIRKYPIPFKKIEYFKFFLGKILFLSYMIALPILMNKPWTIVLSAFFIFSVCTSILALLILLPPHAIEEEKFIQLKDSNMQHSWIEHQFKTTANIKMPNRWFDLLFANFNYHLTHHIYPSLPWHELKAKNIQLKKYCEDNNIEMSNYSMWKALKMHYGLIKRNALNINLFEESM